MPSTQLTHVVPSLPRKSTRNHLLLRLLAIAALLSLGLFCTTAHGGLPETPRGVFSLSPSGKTASQAVLDNPNVMGIAIRYDWASLEPVEGQFDFTFLDSEVARAAAAGKKVMLRIMTQGGKPAWVTKAVQDKGGKFFTFDDDGVPTSIPVFWDGTFLSKKKNMINALGARFANNPAVVVVNCSFANAKTEDWSVPHMAEDIENWFAVGYTTAKMLSAGKQIIDTTMIAFPNQVVAMAIAGNGHAGATGNLDPTADYVAENAIATARLSWPIRTFAPQINSLSTFNPSAPSTDGTIWNLLWNSRPDVGAQMLYWCFDEDTYRVNGGKRGAPAAVLTKCIDAAVSYQLKYVEIYQTDVINLPSVIAYAKQKLAP